MKNRSVELESTRAELKNALSDPSGPEIMLEVAARDSLRVKNVKGGTAHDVLVHSFKNGRLTCGEHRIGYIAEGGSAEFAPMIESDGGHTFSSMFRFDAFLTAAQRGKAAEEKTLQETIPITVTCWDGGERTFMYEFDLYYNFVTQEKRITLKRRSAELKKP